MGPLCSLGNMKTSRRFVGRSIVYLYYVESTWSWSAVAGVCRFAVLYCTVLYFSVVYCTVVYCTVPGPVMLGLGCVDLLG